MKQFLSASGFYKKQFGCKVYKLSIDAGCTCPNRDGTKGIGGCIFCSASGSGDFASSRSLSVREQLNEAKKLVSRKIKSGKYIAYFQNFTNTYGQKDDLLKKYTEALSEKDIVGISIATRPDCIEDVLLAEIALLSQKTFVTVELGLQTCNEKTSSYIRRHYDNEEYLDAVRRIKQASSKIHIVTHIIFGLPFETEKDMLESVSYAVNAGTDGIKIALLHVLKGTELANDYAKNMFGCMSQNEYFELLVKALNIIPENIIIHRLTGDGPKSLLIAPLWTANKRLVHNELLKYLKENGITFAGNT